MQIRKTEMWRGYGLPKLKQLLKSRSEFQGQVWLIWRANAIMNSISMQVLY